MAVLEGGCWHICDTSGPRNRPGYVLRLVRATSSGRRRRSTRALRAPGDARAQPDPVAAVSPAASSRLRRVIGVGILAAALLSAVPVAADHAGKVGHDQSNAGQLAAGDALLARARHLDPREGWYAYY